MLFISYYVKKYQNISLYIEFDPNYAEILFDSYLFDSHKISSVLHFLPKNVHVHSQT